MSATKRPSTSSLRRYLTSRPYLAVADIRRRFGLDPEAMSLVARNGTKAFTPESQGLDIVFVEADWGSRLHAPPTI